MIGIAKGMATTIKHLFRKPITYGYPLSAPRQLPERSRMSFALLTDEQGQPQCKSCLLCQKSCPDDAITILSEKREDGPGRELVRFEIDLGRCMYCGLCVEQCTTSGLVHTGDFETCSAERADMTLVLYAAEPSPKRVPEAVSENDSQLAAEKPEPPAATPEEAGR